MPVENNKRVLIRPLSVRVICISGDCGLFSPSVPQTGQVGELASFCPALTWAGSCGVSSGRSSAHSPGSTHSLGIVADVCR